MASELQLSLSQIMEFIRLNNNDSQILESINQLLIDAFIYGLQYGRFQSIHQQVEDMLQCLGYTKIYLLQADAQQIDKVPLITEFLDNPQSYFQDLILRKIKHPGISIIRIEYPFHLLITDIEQEIYSQYYSNGQMKQQILQHHIENSLMLGIQCARKSSKMLQQNLKIIECLKSTYKLILEFDNLHQDQPETRATLIQQFIQSQNSNIEDLLKQQNHNMINIIAMQSIIRIPDCKICLNPCGTELYIAFSNCNHCFHRECLLNYCKDKILAQQFPMTCPLLECKAEIIDRDLQNILEPMQYEEYLKKSLKQFIDNNSNEYSSCPTAGCQYIFCFVQGLNYFKCNECKKEYCLECRVDFHSGLTCEDYKNYQAQTLRQQNEAVQDNLFLEFARGQNYKQCPQCKFWVEKSQGCNHMSCRCRYQFCYACGGRYPNCNCLNGARAMVVNRRR